MSAAFTLFTAPATFFGALPSPPASAYTLALRRFSSQRVTSHHEDISDVVADTDRINANDVPVIIVSSATLTSIHESPAVNTPAPSSPRSSIISAFTTSSATSSSSRTSFTTSICKTFSRLSLRSSSPSPPPKRSMAQNMDMDICCRGLPKKLYEDLDMDFCCRGEDSDEDEDDSSTAAEDLVEDSADASAVDSPDAAPLVPSTTHNIITCADAEPSLAIPHPGSALPQSKSVKAPVVVTSSKVTLSDESPRSSSPSPYGDTSDPVTVSSCTTSSCSSSLEATKATGLAPPRTMRCAVGTCSASSENCAHFASAQPIIRVAKKSRRKAVASWVRGLASRAA